MRSQVLKLVVEHSSRPSGQEAETKSLERLNEPSVRDTGIKAHLGRFAVVLRHLRLGRAATEKLFYGTPGLEQAGILHTA